MNNYPASVVSDHEIALGSLPEYYSATVRNCHLRLLSGVTMCFGLLSVFSCLEYSLAFRLSIFVAIDTSYGRAPLSARETVLSYWQAMNSNDFHKASEWLTEDFENFAPQSSEKISGRQNFAQMNSSYPANGLWEFTVNSIVCEGDQVVTDVSITDGTQIARAITFHTVIDGLICRQIEYWPDDYDAPDWRSKWVTVLPRGQ